ncbi:MAG: hypothetical protein ABSB01_03475 [Streptosporangiaceae bacterium]
MSTLSTGDDTRAACLGLIAAFKAMERKSVRRRFGRATLDTRRFAMAALPPFEYMLYGKDMQPRVEDVDPHLVLASRSRWRGDDGQLKRL